MRSPHGELKEHINREKEFNTQDAKLLAVLRELRTCLEERGRIFGFTKEEEGLLDLVNSFIEGKMT